MKSESEIKAELFRLEKDLEEYEKLIEQNHYSVTKSHATYLRTRILTLKSVLGVWQKQEGAQDK